VNERLLRLVLSSTFSALLVLAAVLMAARP
jgi:hypothetical protein